MEIDKKGTGIISKLEAFEFVSKDKNIMILYDFIKERLYEDIVRFETNRKDLMDNAGILIYINDFAEIVFIFIYIYFLYKLISRIQ